MRSISIFYRAFRPWHPSQSRRPCGRLASSPARRAKSPSSTAAKLAVRQRNRKVCLTTSFSLFTGVTWLPLRDCAAEARPADETAEAEQGQRSAFCKRATARAAKTGHRNHVMPLCGMTERGTKKAPAFTGALGRPCGRIWTIV